MAKVLRYAIGLDIAKDKFDACLSAINESGQVTLKSSKAAIANTQSGFGELVTWISKHLHKDDQLTLCMEATGIYYEHLAWFLYQQGYSLSVLVPQKAKYYLRSLGIKSKDDKTDAQGLSVMAVQQSLKQWKPFSGQIYELRQLTRFHQQLQETRTMLCNQHQALLCGRVQNSTVAGGLDTLISSVEQQVKQTHQAIVQCLKKDPVLWEKVAHINTVKGLGLTSIATVIAETDGFALFENQAQLVCYCGYDVVRNQSGKREGKTRISKMGNSRIRRILFMPAFNVVRYGISPFAALYERVYARTKLKMKAYVAVQRKLLLLIYTLWKKNEPYDPTKHPEITARLSSFR